MAIWVYIDEFDDTVSLYDDRISPPPSSLTDIKRLRDMMGREDTPTDQEEINYYNNLFTSCSTCNDGYTKRIGYDGYYSESRAQWETKIVVVTSSSPLPACTCPAHNETVATSSSIGHVKPGSGLTVNSSGAMSISTGNGLDIDGNSSLEVKCGSGVKVNSSNNVSLDIEYLAPAGIAIGQLSLLFVVSTQQAQPTGTVLTFNSSSTTKAWFLRTQFADSAGGTISASKGSAVPDGSKWRLLTESTGGAAFLALAIRVE